MVSVAALSSTRARRHLSDGPIADFLTVEEAAEVLRIGRTAAYQLAREFEASEGRVGLPVIRIGRSLRVPRCALESWLGGPLTPQPAERQLDQPSVGRPERGSRRPRRKHSDASARAP